MKITVCWALLIPGGNAQNYELLMGVVSVTNTNLSRILSVLLIIYICCFLMDSFVAIAAVRWLMFITMVIIYLLSFPRATRSTKAISILLLVTGSVIMAYYDTGYQDIMAGLVSNASVICLVLTVPLFAVSLHYEGYQQALIDVIPRYTNTPFKFYAVSMFLVTSLATLLNIASQYFVNNLVKHLADRYPAGIMSRVYTRGFVANMYWSPGYLSVAIVVQYVDIPWTKVAALGVWLACAVFAVGLIVGMMEFGNDKRDMTGTAGPDKEASRPVRKNTKIILGRLLLQVGLMIVLIVAFQLYTHKSALVTVPIVAIASPLLLAVILRKLTIYKARLREYYNDTLPKMHNEIVLFSSFGFAGYALGMSSFKVYIPLVVDYLGISSPPILIIAVAILTSLPCLLGLHPIVTVSSIALALPHGSIPLSDLQMAGALLTGYLAYVCLSPFSASNMLIASLTKDNLWILCKQNLVYTMTVTAVVTTILVSFG